MSKRKKTRIEFLPGVGAPAPKRRRYAEIIVIESDSEEEHTTAAAAAASTLSIYGIPVRLGGRLPPPLPVMTPRQADEVVVGSGVFVAHGSDSDSESEYELSGESSDSDESDESSQEGQLSMAFLDPEVVERQRYRARLARKLQSERAEMAAARAALFKY